MHETDPLLQFRTFSETLSRIVKHGLRAVHGVDHRFRERPCNPERYVACPTPEVENRAYVPGGRAVRKEELNEIGMRLLEVGHSVGEGLLRVFHDLGLGDSLHIVPVISGI